MGHLFEFTARQIWARQTWALQIWAPQIWARQIWARHSAALAVIQKDGVGCPPGTPPGL